MMRMLCVMTHTPPRISAPIAEAIKGRLREAGISHETAADALGIERATLNRRLNGHRTLTADDLLILADLLSVPVADLMAGEAA